VIRTILYRKSLIAKRISYPERKNAIAGAKRLFTVGFFDKGIAPFFPEALP
jgi:hypothetical protein